MLMAALDRRAATYQKMGDLKKALRDARAMIDADPQHTKVHLCLDASWYMVLTEL